MQNIPVFTTSGGTAALILAEIPHKAVAYVRLQTILDLPALLEACAAFCRDCGAERVLATRGPEPLSGPPHAHDVLLLHVDKALLPPPERPATLIPMAEDNDAIYQRVYNRCFQDVPGAATYDRAQIRRIYQEQQRGFLALDGDGAPCGMGELHGNELAAIGLLPEYRGRGLSRDLALTLLSLCPGPELQLTAASTNGPALALYDALGFRVRGVVSRWYQI